MPDYRRTAAWMLDLVDGVGAGQVNLIGNSMGEYFSIAFALAHPKRARSLVLVGAPAGLDRELPLFPRLWGSPIAGPADRQAEDHRPRSLPRPHRRPAARGASRIRVAGGARADGRERRAPRSRARGAHDAAPVTTPRGWRRELMMREALATLDVPTLFVWGDANAFAPPLSGRGVAARMRDARVTVVRDAGHLPWIDYPEAVAATAAAEFMHRFQTAQRIAWKTCRGRRRRYKPLRRPGRELPRRRILSARWL